MRSPRLLLVALLLGSSCGARVAASDLDAPTWCPSEVVADPADPTTEYEVQQSLLAVLDEVTTVDSSNPFSGGFRFVPRTKVLLFFVTQDEVRQHADLADRFTPWTTQVVLVDYTTKQLTEATKALEPIMQRKEFGSSSIGPDEVANRVRIKLSRVDDVTVRALTKQMPRQFSMMMCIDREPTDYHIV